MTVTENNKEILKEHFKLREENRILKKELKTVKNALSYANSNIFNTLINIAHKQIL